MKDWSEYMNRTGSSAFLNFWMIVTYAAMIAVNALANLLPVNGQTTAEVSDKYGNLFAPAGFTFTIWSVIYVLLALHIVYQLGFFRKTDTHAKNALLMKIGIYFSVSSILNSLWILAWQYEKLAVSVVIMILLLLCLIKINKLTAAADLSLKESVFVKLPFSIYFGWITIATIANITAYLVSIGWNGFGISEVTWTIIILFVGTLIGILTMWRQQDIAYGLVFIWAYYGIYSKHVSADGFDGAYPSIVTTVIICLVLIAIASIAVLIKKLRNR